MNFDATTATTLYGIDSNTDSLVTQALFPQGKVHMLSNTSDEEMKVVCFFAPPSELKTYKFHDGIEFPVV